MKRLRFLSFFFCAIAALAFTSCLNDDDDESRLTPEQVQQCYNLTRGTHTGKLYYPKDPASTQTNDNDTVNAQWTINSDSTMVLQNIPAKALAAAITDADVKAAVSSQPDVNIPCYIGYFQNNPIEWLINPQTVTFDKVTYKGENHKVSLAFYINTYYSFGQYSSQNGVMQLQVVVAGAYLDGQTGTSLISRSYPLTFLKR